MEDPQNKKLYCRWSAYSLAYLYKWNGENFWQNKWDKSVLLLRTSSEINSKHGELCGNLMGTHGEPKKRKKIMLMSQQWYLLHVWLNKLGLPSNKYLKSNANFQCYANYLDIPKPWKHICMANILLQSILQGPLMIGYQKGVSNNQRTMIIQFWAFKINKNL